MSFFWRNLAESTQCLLRTHEVLPALRLDETGAQTQWVDNTIAKHRTLADFPSSKVGRRDYPADRRKWICVHQTGVEFGVSKSRVWEWTRRANRAGMSGDEATAWARRMALRERFWTVPYHYVCLLDQGEVLLNNPLSWYTYHGNAANRGLGFAIVGNFPGFESDRKPKHTPVDVHRTHIARSALRQAWAHARAQGYPVEEFRAHRQFSPRRRADPGEWIWSQVVRPVAADVGANVDYQLHQDGGLPIPTAWDPDARYDRQGKAVTERAKTRS